MYDVLHLIHRIYQKTVVPLSFEQPFLVYIFSEHCLDCKRIRDTWAETTQELRDNGTSAQIKPKCRSQ